MQLIFTVAILCFLGIRTIAQPEIIVLKEALRDKRRIVLPDKLQID